MLATCSNNSVKACSVPDTPIHQIPNAAQQIQQNVTPLFDNNSMTPLDDPQYLFQNARCFQHVRELSSTPVKQKSKKSETFHFTNQFLYGCYMPPYYSVLNFMLMNKLVVHLRNPNAPINKLLAAHKDIIRHEQELFAEWLSTTWEENLKSRRLNVIPHIEDYIKSACNFSNGYIKLHYNGTYRSNMKIDYNKEEDEVINKIEMTHCQRIKTSEVISRINLPTIDIKNLESKISFTDGIYNPPQKSPFVKDELCQRLSKEHSCDVSMCLSSIKHVMNLEKPNSLWLIPVNINIDTDNHKNINVGGALSIGHFSQQEKSWYYLRKEIKRKFIKRLSKTADSETVQSNSQYNYDRWTLKVSEVNGDIIKSFNLLVRNKPHIQGIYKSNSELSERVLIPKIEYQPEFGFEKLSEEQLVECWLDTYFRNPRSNFTLVSVQYNMDIMMFKQKNSDNKHLISDDKKQMYLQRLYLTLDKLTQLDKGEYFMLHNPKKPFQVELYQSSVYGGFNLLNMYFVLQQTEVLDSLTWNPIDPEILCPIHDHFKVAPCMFKPNPTLLNIQMINEQVNKYKMDLEVKEKVKKEQLAKRKKIKQQKNKVKRKLKRENNSLFLVKPKMLVKE